MDNSLKDDEEEDSDEGDSKEEEQGSINATEWAKIMQIKDEKARKKARRLARKRAKNTNLGKKSLTSEEIAQQRKGHFKANAGQELVDEQIAKGKKKKEGMLAKLRGIVVPQQEGSDAS